MPTISIFYGIVVQMYWRDHPPPYIPVFYQSFDGIFALEDSALAGGDLPPAVKPLVRGWIDQRRTELLTN